MPRGLVEAQRDRAADLRELGKAFGVSPIAMERRLWFLDHVSA